MPTVRQIACFPDRLHDGRPTGTGHRDRCNWPNRQNSSWLRRFFAGIVCDCPCHRFRAVKGGLSV